MEIDRRFVLKAIIASTAGLSVGVMNTQHASAAGSAAEKFDPSFFVDLLPNGRVRVKITRSELGQGVETGLAQIVADEIGAAWSDIDSVIWHYSKESDHLPEDYDGAGGSMSVRLLWTPLRMAAAAIREMLITAAAQKWDVNAGDCRAESSYVVHSVTGQKATFASLVSAIKYLPVPLKLQLKQTRDFTLIGRSVPSLSGQNIVTGKPRFSIDEHVEGMRFAVIERPPVMGAKLMTVDDGAARQVPGVLDVLTIKPVPKTGHPVNDWETNYRGVVGGVAIIATSTWAAIKGREALQLSWDEGVNAVRSSVSLKEELRTSVRQYGETVFDVGDVETAFRTAEKTYDFTYDSAFQAACPMEPLNAVAHVEGQACTIWAGSQSQSFTGRYIADVLGLDRDKMTVHVRPSGGGFGRRYFYDFMTEAAILSKMVGAPVKVIWTREDDIKHVRAHPARAERLRVALDASNKPVAFDNTAGAAYGDPYGIYGMFNPYADSCAHVRNQYSYGPERLLEVGSWRSVSAHWQSLARECAIDEVAHDLKVDPVDLRNDWLSLPVKSSSDEAAVARMKDGHRRGQYVLSKAAKLCDWSNRHDTGRSLGVALDRYGNTWVCQIVELEGNEAEPKIKKITCVFDCGLVVNPQLVEAQIEGSLVWALQPIIFAPLNVEKGRVVQSNFDDYQMPRMSDMPEIHIEIVKSTMQPSGAGEPAVPSLGPAVLNAHFALVGKRKRFLPLVA